MTESHLAPYALISEREAKDMIWTFIRHGDHSRRNVMSGAPNKSIELWFADQGEPFHRLIPRCRNYFKTQVPFVENLIGSTWALMGNNCDARLTLAVPNSSGHQIEVTGPGKIGVDYSSKFESACKARNAAIEEASLEELHTAIVKGIASIESYIGYKANSCNLSATLSDSGNTKVPFDQKIKNWVPIMADGRALDLSGRMWQDFIFLREIRDNDAIHAKKIAQGYSFSDLALTINKFKTGIADLLLQLHIVFQEPAPRSVIRARYFPNVHERK